MAMAEYVKFRLTAAKAGVTMAFLALLGGIAEAKPWAGKTTRARETAASTAKWQPVLSLHGVTGSLRTSLVRIERDFATVYAKDQKALAAATGKVYAKIERQLDSTFLTDKDAQGEFLAKDATAADAAELGGKTAGAFIQGSGGVATGGATASLTGGLIGLLHSADGTLTVSVGITASGPEVKIQNNSSSAIDWISSVPVGLAASPTNGGTIQGNGFVTLGLGSAATAQVTFQFLPAVQSQAFTLVLSTETASASAGTQRFVGQMVSGDG
jgi:hypothetical protein